MIKTKLTALISTLSLASVICVATAVSANAASVELKYNAEKSSATEKVIDVNYEVDAALVSFSGSLEAKADGAVMTSYECLVNYVATLTKNGAKAGLDWADLDFNCDVAASGTHGRLTITVPEGTGAFDLTFSGIATMDMNSDGDLNPIDDYAPVTITVPAFASVKTVATTDLGTFDTYADEAVSAYTATINSEDAAKTINWVFSNAEGKTYPKAAKIGGEAVISGEATIVLGLKVMGGIPAEVASVTLTVE